MCQDIGRWSLLHPLSGFWPPLACYQNLNRRKGNWIPLSPFAPRRRFDFTKPWFQSHVFVCMLYCSEEKLKLEYLSDWNKFLKNLVALVCCGFLLSVFMNKEWQGIALISDGSRWGTPARKTVRPDDGPRFLDRILDHAHPLHTAHCTLQIVPGTVLHCNTAFWKMVTVWCTDYAAPVALE